jgi:hypothetical protein
MFLFHRILGVSSRCLHYDNENRGRISFFGLSITKKHYWLTRYIFQQIMPSSGDTIVHCIV